MQYTYFCKYTFVVGIINSNFFLLVLKIYESLPEENLLFFVNFVPQANKTATIC